jgi:hypothetical protein
MFATCGLWGAFDAATMIGIIAVRADWIDQPCVLPPTRGCRIGTEASSLKRSAG